MKEANKPRSEGAPTGQEAPIEIPARVGARSGPLARGRVVAAVLEAALRDRLEEPQTDKRLR